MHPQSTPRQQFVRVCECGCGQPTLLARQTDPAKGWVHNQPLRFLLNHHQVKMRGQRGPSYKGFKRTHAGYILRLVPEHPYASKRGYVAEHRLVMEQHLGRYLEPHELVHHRNEITNDNRLENLEVMSHAEHMRYHKAKRPTLPRAIAARPGAWSNDYDECVACHTTEHPYGGRGYCKPCYYLQIRRSQVLKHPIGKWAWRHDACVECGTTERKHAGNGRCTRCQSRHGGRLRSQRKKLQVSA